MGISISKVLYDNEKEVTVSIVGIDGSGKTTILYKLLTGEIVKTIPTTGFNIETLIYKNLKLNIWNLGGNDKCRRHLHKGHCPKSDAIILVIDSNDIDRIDEADDEFHSILELLEENEHSDIPVVIYANKQDLPNALSTVEITEKLNLHSIKQEWFIHGTCAPAGDGLYEGLEWLRQKLK